MYRDRIKKERKKERIKLHRMVNLDERTVDGGSSNNIRAAP